MEIGDIAAHQSLGDLLGDSSKALLYSSTSLDNSCFGEIDPNGDMVVTWGAYISGGDHDGYGYDFYVDSEWT